MKVLFFLAVGLVCVNGFGGQAAGSGHGHEHAYDSLVPCEPDVHCHFEGFAPFQDDVYNSTLHKIIHEESLKDLEELREKLAKVDPATLEAMNAHLEEKALTGLEAWADIQEHIADGSMHEMETQNDEPTRRQKRGGKARGGSSYGGGGGGANCPSGYIWGNSGTYCLNNNLWNCQCEGCWTTDLVQRCQNGCVQQPPGVPDQCQGSGGGFPPGGGGGDRCANYYSCSSCTPVNGCVWSGSYCYYATAPCNNFGCANYPGECGGGGGPPSGGSCQNFYNCNSCLSEYGCLWDPNRGLCKDEADCNFSVDTKGGARFGASGPSQVCLKSRSQCSSGGCSQYYNRRSCQNQGGNIVCIWDDWNNVCMTKVSKNCLQYTNPNECSSDWECRWDSYENSCVLKSAGGGGGGGGGGLNAFAPPKWDYAVKGQNDAILDNVYTDSECANRCLNANFYCASFEYAPAGNRCVLSSGVYPVVYAQGWNLYVRN